MADQRQRMKRAGTIPSCGINGLINAANKNDRFKLLEDDAVLPANLTNPVHPIFRQLEGQRHLHLALQLASQFLLHDRLLEFFVPLLFGRQMHSCKSQMTYLSDPMIYASEAKQAQLLSAVRDALLCLADRTEICFVDHEKQLSYARTIATDFNTTLATTCCKAHQKAVSPKIELNDKFLRFYSKAKGYALASRCAQYRHDFLFAATLVHEVVHAVGVMRRGDLVEPHYRQGYPETEWGYAWENFMFGSILNPQDKNQPGTHLLMRKVWADRNIANANGGKEYCDVSMSWIAQWFRNETWNIVAEQGPTAIAPPVTHFKVQISHRLGAWVITSDRADVRKDISELYKHWQRQNRQLKFEEPTEDGRQASYMIYFNNRTKAQLQESNVPIPPRVRDTLKPSLIKTLLSSGKPDHGIAKPLCAVNKPPTKTPLVIVDRTPSPCGTRKRRTNIDDFEQSLTGTKRIRPMPLSTHDYDDCSNLGCIEGIEFRGLEGPSTFSERQALRVGDPCCMF